MVLTLDLLWSLILEKLGRPLVVGLFPGQAQDANRLLDSQLMPMLWISYGIVLSAQIGWLAWASRQQSLWRHNVPIGYNSGGCGAPGGGAPWGNWHSQSACSSPWRLSWGEWIRLDSCLCWRCWCAICW